MMPRYFSAVETSYNGISYLGQPSKSSYCVNPHVVMSFIQWWKNKRKIALIFKTKGFKNTFPLEKVKKKEEKILFRLMSFLLLLLFLFFFALKLISGRRTFQFFYETDLEQTVVLCKLECSIGRTRLKASLSLNKIRYALTLSTRISEPRIASTTFQQVSTFYVQDLCTNHRYDLKLD